MDQHNEHHVRQQLEPYHNRILQVIERGHGEWVAVKNFMIHNGYGSVLYPRTIANFVFDAVVRHAITEFGNDDNIRTIAEAQTVKFCFGETVLMRFKKGDEDNLGQNLLTQAVIDFIFVQKNLPGFAPKAAKIEVLYSASDIDDRIERVVVAARDGDQLLWHYRLDKGSEADDTIPLVPSITSSNEGAGEVPIIVPRKRDIANDAGG